MKILQVSSLHNITPPSGYGGTERFVHALSKELGETNEVYTIVKNGSPESTNYTSVFATYDTLEETLKKTIDEIKPDIINSHIKDLAFSETIRNTDIPVLFTAHNNIRKESSWSKVALATLKKTNWHLSAISESLHDRFLECAAIPNLKIYIPGIGLDCNTGPLKDLQKEFFIYIGTIARYKAVLDIVKAFKGLDEQLLVVGPNNNSQEKKYFSEVLTHIESSSNIKYFGETKDENEKTNLLLKSKGLILATGYDPLENDCHEAFGLVMLEANMHGVPVLGYKQGNIKDYIEDGVNGYLFDDMKELPRLIEQININAKTLRNQSIEYSKNFCTEKIALKYLEIYKKLILDSKA